MQRDTALAGNDEGERVRRGKVYTTILWAHHQEPA